MHLAVTAYPAFQAEHLLNRQHGVLGFAFLDKTDQGVDQHHGKDHRTVEPFAQQESKQASAEQDVDQQVVKLQHKALKRPVGLWLWQQVGTMLAEALGGVGTVQTLGTAVEVLQALLPWLGVPVMT